MTERSRWFALRKRLTPYGRLVRVENSVEAGTPDVCYCLRGVTGWLELKHLPRWPKRATSPIKVPSLTYEQVEWAAAWSGVGGTVYLYLSIERDEFLIPPGLLGQLHAGYFTVDMLLKTQVGTPYRSLPSRPTNNAQLVSWLMGGL